MFQHKSFRYLLISAASAAVCTVSASALAASAAEEPEEKLLLGAGGLISSYYVKCSAGEHKITVSGRTVGPKELAEIGMQDIEVQRSANGEDGWVCYAALGDRIGENVSYYYLQPVDIAVGTGYYRVVLTHYAKEKGWFFPKKQYVTQNSVTVHVS